MALLVVNAGFAAAAEPKPDPEVYAIMQSSRSIDAKIEALKSLATQKNADAATALGVIYQLGLGGAAKDNSKAAKWYLVGAKLGNAQAQQIMGSFYKGGLGVPMDMEKAAYWYRKALENGITEVAQDLKETEQLVWMSKSGWVPIDRVCESDVLRGMMDCSGPIMVTAKKYITHWAGEVVEAYYSKSANNFTRYKISVTWITDRSPYTCGQIIEKRLSEIKDFKTRSMAMKRCE